MNPKRRCDAEENAKSDPPTSIRHLAIVWWKRLFNHSRLVGVAKVIYTVKRTATEQKRRISDKVIAQGL
jgi:hypothetical protein